MKHIFLAAICVAVLLPCAPAPATAQDRPLVIDPLADGITLAAGLGSSLASELWLRASTEGMTLPSAGDRASLPWLDGIACFPYDEGLSKASLATLGLGLALPATLALGCAGPDLLSAAVCYSEALLWTFAAKNAMKALFPKARPYTYYGAPADGELADEAWESFPSGHAALAFCSATAFTALALDLMPERPETPWLIGGAYLLACGTSGLRVASGQHFIGDVAAGAVLGSAIGYLVVRLHERAPSSAASPAARLQFRPQGLPILVLSYRLP
jgi:undecaprenyl-diphosphatase